MHTYKHGYIHMSTHTYMSLCVRACITQIFMRVWERGGEFEEK